MFVRYLHATQFFICLVMNICIRPICELARLSFCRCQSVLRVARGLSCVNRPLVWNEPAILLCARRLGSPRENPKSERRVTQCYSFKYLALLE